MKMRAIAGLSLSALMLGGSMVGCTQGGIASASSRSEANAIKQAAISAGKAERALAKGDATAAVAFAEVAVALRPQDAGYRQLLGGAYLKAGRFASAHAAYGDVLTLAPDNGKAALNMTLAMIAEGQWDAARKALDTHAAIIPASDRGLAMALAGDPASGVDVLIAATRTPQADGKTRQNLALAMALAGRWKEARSIIGVDMAPLDADQRIVQWAAFAKPAGKADQVAALLGVKPAEDPGQPVALALNAAVPVAVAAAEPVATPVPVVETTPAPTRAAEPLPVAVASNGIVFGARHEVVQPLPLVGTPMIAARGAFKVAARDVPRAAPAKGDWYVQLGAFHDAGVARDAWSRAQRRYAGLSGHVPAAATFTSGSGKFHRLSVGGFSRSEADALCRSYRSRGGACFVRAGAGDQLAAWAKPAATQLAAVTPRRVALASTGAWKLTLPSR